MEYKVMAHIRMAIHLKHHLVAYVVMAYMVMDYIGMATHFKRHYLVRRCIIYAAYIRTCV